MMKKFIFWINAHTQIEKQSNKDWNTPKFLKVNSPHIKVPLIFWFLIMTFNLWVCIHIGNSSEYIEQTHSQFLKYLWMFGTEWNAHQIGILDNLLDWRQSQQHVINTSTWSKKSSTVYSKYNNFVYLSRNVYLLEI